MFFWADYYLRWWRLPIEERACRKTDLGGGDYYLRNSGLPPSCNPPGSVVHTMQYISLSKQIPIIREHSLTELARNREGVQSSSKSNHRHPNLFCGKRAPQLVISATSNSNHRKILFSVI